LEKFKQTYFGLSQGALLALLVIFMLATGAIMYTVYLSPILAKTAAADKQLDSIRNAHEAQQQKLRLIQANPLDEDKTEIPPADMQWLTERGNELVYETERNALVEQIKGTSGRSGCKNISTEMGESEEAYVKAGEAGDVFRIGKQQMTLRCLSNYNGTANFLFQLRAMGRAVKVEKVEMISVENSGEVGAAIVMNLFYVEGANPRTIEEASEM
jgi:hypothetical protein